MAGGFLIQYLIQFFKISFETSLLAIDYSEICYLFSKCFRAFLVVFLLLIYTVTVLLSENILCWIYFIFIYYFYFILNLVRF